MSSFQVSSSSTKTHNLVFVDIMTMPSRSKSTINWVELLDADTRRASGREPILGSSALFQTLERPTKHPEKPEKQFDLWQRHSAKKYGS